MLWINEGFVGEDGAPLPRPVKRSERQDYKRATVKERKEERKERRLETRNSEGQVLSSDIERREKVEERVATNELETDDRRVRDLCGAEEPDDDARHHPVPDTEDEQAKTDVRDDEDAVAKEVALEKRDWKDEDGRDEFVIPVVHRGSGRRFQSFGEMLEDPTAPMSPFASTWETSACSPEEIVKSYGAVATLALKITRVAVEHRQAAASACWHALQCINHIYARLGDIVDSIWIERDRFAVGAEDGRIDMHLEIAVGDNLVPGGLQELSIFPEARVERLDFRCEASAVPHQHGEALG